MLKPINLLYNCTIDYSFIYTQRPNHLMRLLSEKGDYKVYWVNNTQVPGKRREEINENLTVYHDWEIFRKRFEGKIDVHFISWAARFVDIPLIKPKMVVYDSLDLFPENEKDERNMVSKADVLLTTSQPLYDYHKNNHNNIHMCRNACFPELGEKQYAMPDIIKQAKSMGQQVVLFSGAIGNWVDVELMDYVSHSDKYVIMVVGSSFGVPQHLLPKNIVYLGTKKYEELQAYYQHCDVTLLPFKRCQTSDYSNPIKTFESLSFGKPVISTDIPESCIFPENTVFVSGNKEEFRQNINKALKICKNEEIINKCKEVARENSWQSRVDIIDREIKRFINNKGIAI